MTAMLAQMEVSDHGKPVMPFDSIQRLVLVGCGKMGGALLDGWLKLGLEPTALVVLDPNLPHEREAQLAALGAAIEPDVPAPADVVLIAVKPQVMDVVLPALKGWVGPRTAVISIAAGKTIWTFEKAFGHHTSIIRTIPNTPAAVGRGMTVGVANKAATPEHRALAAGLLSAIGAFDWLEDESLMDAVTAVSGSGPAYVFHLVEALAAAGVAQGLPPVLAAKIARVTIEGSGELLRQSPLDPATLRQHVTSPGGTTAAALKFLMDDKTGFPPLLKAAVEAATQRGKELGG